MNRYDKLSNQIDQVRLAVERLTGHVESINTRNSIADKILSDYESRLRALERWRYALPTSMVLAVGSAVAAVFAAVHP